MNPKKKDSELSLSVQRDIDKRFKDLQEALFQKNWNTFRKKRKGELNESR